jgi:hypothetical protein
MISVPSTAQLLAVYYGTLGRWVGAATGNPGTSQTPSLEATGGSPSYLREETTWSAGSVETGGQIIGSTVTVNLQAATYTYIILASGQSGNNMIDSAEITTTKLKGQGTLVIEPVYNQN